MTRGRQVGRAALLLTGAVGVYALAVLTPVGQAWDAASLGWFSWLPPSARAAAGWGRDVGSLVILAALVLGAAVAVVLRRAGDAATALAAVVATALVAGRLRVDVLARPDLGDFGYDFNTYPSGHAAVVTAACAGLVLLLPPRLRRGWWSALVAAPAVVAAVGSVATLAHRASDVLGGMLLAGAIVTAATALAIVGRTDACDGYGALPGVVPVRPAPRSLAVGAAALAVCAGAAALTVGLAAVNALALASLLAVVAWVVIAFLPAGCVSAIPGAGTRYAIGRTPSRRVSSSVEPGPGVGP